MDFVTVSTGLILPYWMGLPIRYIQIKMKILLGNIFDSKCSTLVNTVNCAGVMGKGIALEFKKRYPEMFREYQILCKEGKVQPGKPYLYHDLTGASIINFPTKDHW